MVKKIGEPAEGLVEYGSREGIASERPQLVLVFEDEIPPMITPAASPAPNAAGWSSSDVTVAFACADSGSGIASCTSPVLVQTEAIDTIGGTAVDNAGNTANASIQVKLDKSPPVIQVTSHANGATVNTSTVTISGTVTDNLSGVTGLICNGNQGVVTGGTFQCDVGLIEGLNSIAVIATDLAGNTSSQNISLTYDPPDTVPPTLTITAPAEGSSFNAAVIPLSGTATDNEGVASVTVNGDPVELTNGAFQTNINLVDGNNTINVIATDVAGNQSTKSIVVNRYSIPEIAISAPADLTWATTTTITVSGTVSDPDGTVNVNGVAATVSGGSFTASSVPLIEGGNILTATVTDTNGRIASASVRVIRDLTPPEVAIDFPANGAILRQNAVTVTGLINDITMGTVNEEHAQVTVNGIVAQVSNRSFLAVDVPLLAGSNVITASATDASSNTNIATINVTFQAITAEPQIKLVSGNNQVANIGTEAAQPLVVELLDAAGNPAPNKTVIFKVMENNGMVCDTSNATCPANATNFAAITTDSQGRAAARWKLGSRAGAGNNVVQASSVGFTGLSLFTATGGLGTVAEIHMDSGTNQYGVGGQLLPRPFVAVVTDAGHNRLSDVPVTFTVVQGGGDFAGQPTLTITTDMDGRAVAFLNLGVEAGIGNNVVEANFPGATGLPAVFVASGKVAGDAAATKVSGVVLDNSNVPIEGVTIRIDDTTLTTETNDQGQFEIQPAPVGHVELIVDGSTANRPGSWPTLEYEMVTVSGQNNTVNMPIYLLPIDLGIGLYIDETHGGTLTLPAVPGFSLTIAAGSATFPDGTKKGTVSVTVVHSDKIPMVPNFGQQPRFIVTIQPAGVRFDPPAPITIPNLDGLAPGKITELYSFDHDLGSFVSIGTGSVSRDGTIIQSDNGVGIVKGGWHCGGGSEYYS